MSLQDAIGLVRNGDTSNSFFQEKTTTKLIAAFTPVIQSSLDKVDATKYYGDLVTKYNNLPTTIKKINPDLTSYVTGKSHGSFVQSDCERRSEYPYEFCSQNF
jgi:hypothetical protein